MHRMGDVQLGRLAKEQRERRAHPRRGAPAQPSCGWLRDPLPVDKETGRCGFEAERQGIDNLVLFLVVVALVLIVGILLAPLGAGIAVVRDADPDRDPRLRGLGAVFRALSARS